MIENRQKRSWDSYLPGHGMLVTKVSHVLYKWSGGEVNNDANAMGVNLLEADGLAPARVSGNYTNGYYGHVGIYESDYSTYHQNWSGCMYTVQYNGLYSWRCYWGCIHPNFGDDPQIEETEAETVSNYHGADDKPVSVLTAAAFAPDSPLTGADSGDTPDVAGASEKLSSVIGFFTMLVKGLAVISGILGKIIK